MKLRYLILMLLIASCGASKKIPPIEIVTATDSCYQAPLTKQDIKLAKVEARKEIKIAKINAKANKKEAKQVLKKTKVELKSAEKQAVIKFKRNKDDNSTLIDSMRQDRKKAVPIAKQERKIANSENNKDIAKWIGISICAILLLVVILFVYLKFIR
jgi:cell division protein FtsX